MAEYIKEQRSVLITIPVGGNEGKVSTEDIPSGDKVFLGATAKPAQDSLVRITVKRNGHEVVRAMDVSWLDGGVGSFENRSMQIADKGGSRLDFYVTTSTNVTNTPLYIELILLVYVPVICK